jgi:signal peptidase
MTRLRFTLGVGFLLVFLVLGAGWTLVLRPPSLGGPAGYVLVRGVSMLPTYRSGDLVITQRKQAYAKGEVVAYRIPKGQIGEGIIVIHRIVGGSARDGYVLKGDNNNAPDEWRPRPRDIVGAAWLHLPHAGQVLAWLHAPVPLASLTTAIAVAMVLVPRPDQRSSPVGEGNDALDDERRRHSLPDCRD